MTDKGANFSFFKIMPQFLFMESNVILAAFLAQHNVTSLQFKCRLAEEYKTKRNFRF